MTRTKFVLVVAGVAIVTCGVALFALLDGQKAADPASQLPDYVRAADEYVAEIVTGNTTAAFARHSVAYKQLLDADTWGQLAQGLRDSKPLRSSYDVLDDASRPYDKSLDPRQVLYGIELRHKPYELEIIMVKNGAIWQVDEMETYAQ